MARCSVKTEQAKCLIHGVKKEKISYKDENQCIFISDKLNNVNQSTSSINDKLKLTTLY
jgi:hypothetical protein